MQFYIMRYYISKTVRTKKKFSIYFQLFINLKSQQIICTYMWNLRETLANISEDQTSRIFHFIHVIYSKIYCFLFYNFRYFESGVGS